MPKVSREHEQRRRNEILRAALKCFARRGYHETTMDDVVDETGLSKGALYQYFKGKEDLFRGIRRLQLDELQQRLENAFTGAEGVREKLKRGARVFVSTLRSEYGDLARIGLEFWSEASRRSDLRREFRRDYATWRSFLEQIIAEGVRTGEFRADVRPEALASVILTICDGLSLHWVMYRDTVDPEELMSAFLSAVLEGVVVKAASKSKSR